MNGSPQQQPHQEPEELPQVPPTSQSSATSQTSLARNSAGIELSDDEEWSSLVERAVLERTKSDRLTRADEDRRRRTIIVEKKNGTYGFTLQSYGIHYKREQEIEMVTYVDFVEYDGPAFKAGMREGDVIVSINGQEMDRADHKTLVNFIKNCDARMRMVVSFEDCVRKVELHMRYIELQRALQTRLIELERLCERERSILMGRWKTHSLPARKRTPSTQTGADSGFEPSSGSSLGSSGARSCYRPTSSTEQLLLYSVYADGRSFLIPRSAACLVAVGPPRSRSDHHHFLSSIPVEKKNNSSTSSSRHSYHQVNGISNTKTPSKSKDQSSHNNKSNKQQESLHMNTRNLCVACISSATRRNQANRNQAQGDNGSLDAYDLASPCCDPNCVPTRKHKEKHRKSRHEQSSQAHQHQAWHHHLQQQQQQQKQQQQREQCDGQQQIQSREQYSNEINCSRASGHSLHSIGSSETGAGSVVSCSTSLSTDTLYWDPNVQHRPPPCLQYIKPKSWDNLTTKSFGGYGFGYGYLDTAKTTQSAERPSKSEKKNSLGNSSSSSHHGRAKTPTPNCTMQQQQQQQRRSSVKQKSQNSNRQFQPTKSSESLLISTSFGNDLDATLSCECLDGPNPRFIAVQLEKHKRQGDSHRGESHGSQHQTRHRRSSNSEAKQRSITSSEITRL